MLLVWLTAVVGTAYPNVIDAFGILGGYLAVPIVVYYPGLVYVKLSRKPWTHPKKIFLIIITTILCLIGYTAATISLLSFLGIWSPDSA